MEIILVGVGFCALLLYQATLSGDARSHRSKQRARRFEELRAAERDQKYKKAVEDQREELLRERELLRGTGKVPFVDWEESFMSTHTIRFRRPSQPRVTPAGWSVGWDRDQLLRQEGLCFWCGSPLNGAAHRDHVHPLAGGGANDVGNLVMACPPCNLDKGAKHPLRWLTATNRVSEERKAKLGPLIDNGKVTAIEWASDDDPVVSELDELVEFDIVQLRLFEE